jgi:glutathione synthase/RimK-type ligase-like ATP-grasp enzyme
MILLWGLANDPPLGAVRDRLGADVVFVDHAAVARTRVRVDGDAFTLELDDTVLELEAVTAAYLRPYDSRLYGPDVPTTAAGVHHLVYEWAESTQAVVVNRPSAEASNHSKLLQAHAIRESGLATPESLVTNESERILEFRAQHGSVIYKSLSSIRSVVAELDPDALPAGAMGPAFIQQRVRGTNVRAHVVGDRTFACAVESEGVDYRYASARLFPVTLPPDVAERCIALASRLGLLLAGIDLIEGEDGDWYCLEANPSPAFTAFDHGGAIAAAVVELLS